jgi:serine/threonine protein kinase
MGACLSTPQVDLNDDTLGVAPAPRAHSRRGKRGGAAARAAEDAAARAAKEAARDSTRDMGLGEHYVFEGLVGAGASGTTYRAWDISAGRHVAVKLVPRPLPRPAVAPMLQELLLHADMAEASAHVVNLTHAALTRTHLALVMDYAPGGNLADLVGERWETALTRGGLHLSEAETLFAMGQIVEAVAACHRRNVAHRDLKMDNTLIGKAPWFEAAAVAAREAAGPDPTAKKQAAESVPLAPRLLLCDFGFAKSWGKHNDSGAMVDAIGTPVYMSPQLLAARAAGQALNEEQQGGGGGGGGSGGGGGGSGGGAGVGSGGGASGTGRGRRRASVTGVSGDDAASNFHRSNTLPSANGKDAADNDDFGGGLGGAVGSSSSNGRRAATAGGGARGSGGAAAEQQPAVLPAGVRSFSAPKADVWACGVLMHAMLFGFFPFDHEAHPDPNSDAASMDVWIAATRGGWRANPRVVSGKLATRISTEAADLLDRLLQFDEARRPDVQAVLAHPWMRRGGRSDAEAPPLPATLPSNVVVGGGGSASASGSSPPPPPSGLLPVHAAAWEALRAEQRELDEQRARPRDELVERRREQALLTMLALSSRAGAATDRACWRVPLSRHAPVEAFEVPRAEDKVAGRALGKVLDDQGRRQERLGVAGAQIRRLSCEWPRKWAQGDGGGSFGVGGWGSAASGASASAAANLNSGVVAASKPVLVPSSSASSGNRGVIGRTGSLHDIAGG